MSAKEEYRTYFRLASKGDDMNAFFSVLRFEACPHTTYITLQQPSAKIVRSFRRYVRPLLDDLKINCRGEIFIEQIARRQYLVGRTATT
jgi:hypothetical protein